MATATDERTTDFVMVKADRENAQANVLHVRLKDGSLALATMADITRVCALAVADKTGDGLAPKDEYVATCVLITPTGARVSGSYRYPAKYLKTMTLPEQDAMRSKMERQAERVAYHTMGKETDETTVAHRLMTWAEPL